MITGVRGSAIWSVQHIYEFEGGLIKRMEIRT